MGTNEKNTGIIENFVCFIYGGAGSRSPTFAPAPALHHWSPVPTPFHAFCLPSLFPVPHLPSPVFRILTRNVRSSSASSSWSPPPLSTRPQAPWQGTHIICRPKTGFLSRWQPRVAKPDPDRSVSFSRTRNRSVRYLSAGVGTVHNYIFRQI